MYCKDDVENMVGQTIAYHLRWGSCPQPDIHFGEKSFFSLEQAEKVKQYFAFLDSLLTKVQAAKQLGIAASLMQDYTDAGLLPEPTHQQAKRKLYTQPEVDAMKITLANLPSRHHSAVYVQHCLDEGLYSVKQAAKALGCPHVTLQYWIAQRQVPTPNKKVQSRFYYLKDDLDAIRQIKKGYFDKHYSAKPSKTDPTTQPD